MEKEEAMKILKDFYDKSALFSVRTALDTVFPELKESEDERVKKELIELISCMHDADPRKERWLAWLEKQGNVNALIQEAAEKSYTEGMRVERKRWLEKQGEQNLASSAKISKNEDTFLDLLHKMPSCITVDGIDYHFVLKKTVIYMAFYEGEGEGSGKVIFWMAGDPIVLLMSMLKKLKEKGLLDG